MTLRGIFDFVCLVAGAICVLLGLDRGAGGLIIVGIILLLLGGVILIIIIRDNKSDNGSSGGGIDWSDFTP